MLRDVLELFHTAPHAPLTREAIARQLDIPPGLLDQLLHMLVRMGRLVEVSDCGDACPACPLARVCVGGLELRSRGYMLPVR